ncbi:MAG: Uma2 family endonuclease [Actinomycetota bacterium]|nr:Uma2 family endonuclease [Actinomycetota bacterium]
MAVEPRRLFTYTDLQAFPEDNLRREIIDGELFVTAAPRIRHQRVVATLTYLLGAYSRERGGEVFPAPTDVFFTDTNVVEPDVLFVRGDHLDRLGDRFVRSAPDLVVEISSPSTRKLELVRKRELYERFGVPEYWYVDLDVDLVHIYRLSEGYGLARIVGRGETIEAMSLPGLVVRVDDLLGPPEDDDS